MKVFSIFNSISGEIGDFRQGDLATFIRVSGCNLRCHYCDSKKALTDGRELGIKDIVADVINIGCKKVIITGGEPLVQKEDFLYLAKVLRRTGHEVSVETNGTLPLESEDVHSWIMDYKLRDMGVVERQTLSNNIYLLTNRDWVKFLIANGDEYERAKSIYGKIKHIGNFGVAFSMITYTPVRRTDLLNITWLISQMSKDRLFDVRVNLQLHKLAGLTEDNSA